MRRFWIWILSGVILLTPSKGFAFNQVETEHYIVMKNFMNNYEKMLDILMSD